MRVVALISGGKDSCYNMMQCVVAGHSIVALANLQPQHRGYLPKLLLIIPLVLPNPSPKTPHSIVLTYLTIYLATQYEV